MVKSRSYKLRKEKKIWRNIVPFKLKVFIKDNILVQIKKTASAIVLKKENFLLTE